MARRLEANTWNYSGGEIITAGGKCPDYRSVGNSIYPNNTVCHILHTFFGGGEGPRSRSYGRTAALRLIVQPCDEDD
jgi:hypothetical protein